MIPANFFKGQCIPPVLMWPLSSRNCISEKQMLGPNQIKMPFSQCSTTILAIIFRSHSSVSLMYACCASHEPHELTEPFLFDNMPPPLSFQDRTDKVWSHETLLSGLVDDHTVACYTQMTIVGGTTTGKSKSDNRDCSERRRLHCDTGNMWITFSW